MKTPSLVDEIESTISGAAAGQKVTLVILSMGSGVSVAKEEIVKRLSEKYPGASIDIKDGGPTGSVTVKEIEVG
jgi:chorismate synthase